MATTFKNFLSNDLANTRTLLHEAIPITGSIVSGTYADDGNIKTYGHGMFKSVYDYPYLSSSANHIFDITTGYSVASSFSGSSSTQNSKKINLYNQMAQYLVGYDDTGNIKKFTMPTDGTVMNECFFVPFARLLSKDEIKKGSVSLEFGLSSSFSYAGDAHQIRGKLIDYSGSDGYYVDSPAGEYGVLYVTASTHNNILKANRRFPAGLLYYQAGIAVITASIFTDEAMGGLLNNSFNHVQMRGPSSTAEDVNAVLTGSLITGSVDNFRTRLYNLSFNNTTELNSSIYFCRVNHDEFNYSSNPTYLNNSKIRVKTKASEDPISYITTIGLYSAANELMAVAKLSEPLKKTPSQEFTLRVRLDY